MLALAATRFCSAPRISGRRCSSAAGRSPGICGAISWSMVLPRGIGPGLRAQQDRQQVFLRGDGLLELRDCRARLLRLRADLRQLRHRDHAGLVAQLEDAQRALEVARGGLRDLQLPVQRAQHDVAGSDAGHQRQHHAALALLAGIDLGLRGLGLAAHAAEQVGLPARAQRHVVEREVRAQRRRHRRKALGAGARARGVGAVADLRIELRAGGGQRTDELVHPGGGDAQVAVVAQRGLDQLVQHWVAELLPPLQVGYIGGLRVVDAPGGGRVHRRAHVVRAHGAAGQERSNAGGDGMQLHLDILPSIRWQARQ